MNLQAPKIDAAPRVPAAQIAETRRCFPASRLLFEVELAAPAPWQALAFCARAFAEAGLALAGLRCTGEGAILCRLRDRPGARLDVLDRAFVDAPGIRLCRWTTVLVAGSAAS